MSEPRKVVVGKRIDGKMTAQVDPALRNTPTGGRRPTKQATR